MRCFVATKKGTQCAHNITSGYTFTWYQYMVRTCKQHGEMIHHGTLLLSATTVVYKGEVALTPAHAVCEVLELDLHVDTTPVHTHTCAPTTTHGVRCGACSTHDAPVYHAHVDDVRACYVHMHRDTTCAPTRTHMGSVRPTPMGTPTMPPTTRAILCGACHGYHPTHADVKACYMERKYS